MRRAKMFPCKHPAEKPSLYVCVRAGVFFKNSLRQNRRFRHEGGEKSSTEKMRRYPRAVSVHSLGILVVFASILIFTQDFLRAHQWSVLEKEGEKSIRRLEPSATMVVVIFFFKKIQIQQQAY